MKSKALVLLFIFLLNTITGFACALRMGAHEQNEDTEHQHESKHTEHRHKKHQQIASLSGHQHLALYATYISKTDRCCQGAVNNFNAIAKVTPQSNHVILLAPFIYIAAYYQFLLKPISENKSSQLLSLDERQRPPTNPIRITIQSFQI